MSEAFQAERAASVAAVARGRGISQLVHFTPLNNLIGIMELRALAARDRVLELARQKADQHLLDYIAFNDRLRLDRRTGYVNLSIQHPNARLFRRFRTACTWCDVWCVLLIVPDCLDAPGVLFSIGNAAASQVRQTGTGAGLKSFEALFREAIIVSNRLGQYRLVRGELTACHPTDPQAEVLYPDEVPLTFVQALAFENPMDRARAHAAMKLAIPGVLLPSCTVNPELFQERNP
jgi:hypothetical protein